MYTTRYTERLDGLFYSQAVNVSDENLDEVSVPKLEIDKFIVHEIGNIDLSQFHTESFELDCILTALMAVSKFISMTQIANKRDISYEAERHIAHHLMLAAYYEIGNFVSNQLTDRKFKIISELLESRYDRRRLSNED